MLEHKPEDELPLNIEAEEEEESDEGLFEHYSVVVDKGQSLMRVDRFLGIKLSNFSRNKIQLAIDAGFIKVNGNETKASYKVKPDDQVVLSFPKPPRETDILPENIPLDIRYEDEHLMVINKPAGLVVHPAVGNWTGTLVNALVFHFQSLPGDAARPGLVHRIDKDTSGLLVIAKSELAMVKLAKDFFYHNIERSYLALVWGEPNPSEGTINVNLVRHPKDRRLTLAVDNPEMGRHAITHYKTIENFHYTSLVKCTLETGRTHQIRAHMKHIGHTLFGDSMYGGDQILKGSVFSKYRQFVDNALEICPRQALHAHTLGFDHPITGKPMFFEEPLPADMSAVIDKWRSYAKIQ